jgi:fatty acid desaturase
VSTTLRPVGYYAAALRSELPPEVFRRVPRRLWWLPLHLGIVAGAFLLIAQGPGHPTRMMLALLAGHSLGCLSLLGHEIMHGVVVKGRWSLRLLGGLCMVQYGLLPGAWMAWHNHWHHGKTQLPGSDPDCAGTVDIYRFSPALRAVYGFMPGARTLRSCLFMFVNFSLHSARVLFTVPILPRRTLIPARVYMVTVLSLWFLAACLQGVGGLVYLLVLPLAISNALMMSYIATNHFLSPLSEGENDPLVNSLTVRTFRLIELLHLQFNFHVEHHVFPAVSPSHARTIAAALKRRWPDRYQEMEHGRALLLLYRTPRLYQSRNVLLCPRTGRQWRLGSGGPAPMIDRSPVG